MPLIDPDGLLPDSRSEQGGILAGDDYVEGGWWAGGVKRAVEEFLTTAPFRLELLRNDQFVLVKKAGS